MNIFPTDRKSNVLRAEARRVIPVAFQARSSNTAVAASTLPGHITVAQELIDLVGSAKTGPLDQHSIHFAV